MHTPNPSTVGLAHNNDKKREKKKRTKEGQKSGQRVKPSTPILINDELIEEG